MKKEYWLIAIAVSAILIFSQVGKSAAPWWLNVSGILLAIGVGIAYGRSAAWILPKIWRKRSKKRRKSERSQILHPVQNAPSGREYTLRYLRYGR